MEREFDLEPGEHVIKEVRMHWFFFFIQLLPIALLALIPFLILPAIKLAGPALAPLSSRFSGWAKPWPRFALGIWWLLLWSAAFNIFTRYFLNAWIITNQRIVELKQHGFFNRQVSSLLLNRVQDITIETSGLIRSLLDIGDINVQTAGTVDHFTMRNVPHPAWLRDKILQSTASTAQSGTGL